MEYISKQSLLADLNETTPRSYFAFETMVREYPTEDVAPVVHAHWIEKKYRIAPDTFISNAHCSACDGISKTGYTDFCPHCGAKMDGGDL